MNVAVSNPIEVFRNNLPNPVRDAIADDARFTTTGDTLEIHFASKLVAQIFIWLYAGYARRAAEIVGIRYVQIWLGGVMIHIFTRQSWEFVENIYLG